MSKLKTTSNNVDWNHWKVRDIPCNCSIELPEVRDMGYNSEGMRFYFCRLHNHFIIPSNQVPILIDRAPQITPKTKAQISFL